MVALARYWVFQTPHLSGSPLKVRICRLKLDDMMAVMYQLKNSVDCNDIVLDCNDIVLDCNDVDLDGNDVCVVCIDCNDVYVD